MPRLAAIAMRPEKALLTSTKHCCSRVKAVLPEQAKICRVKGGVLRVHFSRGASLECNATQQGIANPKPAAPAHPLTHCPPLQRLPAACSASLPAAPPPRRPQQAATGATAAPGSHDH